jgi:hypothetical protein
MDAASTGEYIAIVVRLRPSSDGTWYLDIDGTTGARSFPLVPLDLVIRLRKTGDDSILRGTLRLDGDDLLAPFQSNAQLVELVRAWLLRG